MRVDCFKVAVMGRVSKEFVQELDVFEVDGFNVECVGGLDSIEKPESLEGIVSCIKCGARLCSLGVRAYNKDRMILAGDRHKNKAMLFHCNYCTGRKTP